MKDQSKEARVQTCIAPYIFNYPVGSLCIPKPPQNAPTANPHLLWHLARHIYNLLVKLSGAFPRKKHVFLSPCQQTPKQIF